MALNREKIQSELEDSVKENDLDYLTNLIYKYANPREMNSRPGPNIAVNEAVDYLKFVQYMHRDYMDRKGQVSMNTIKKYVTYLSHYELDPDKPEDVEAYFEKKPEYDGQTPIIQQKAIDKGFYQAQDPQKYIRFRYNSYLAIKKYLKMLEQEEGRDRGYYTNRLPEKSSVKKPDINPNTFRVIPSGTSKEQRVDREQESIDEMVQASTEGDFFYSHTFDAKLIVLLSADCGLRIGEILNLKHDWIQFIPNEADKLKGKVTLPACITKSGDEEEVFLTPRTVEGLKEQMNIIDDYQDWAEDDEEYDTYLIDLKWSYRLRGVEDKEDYLPYLFEQQKTEDRIQRGREWAIGLIEEQVEYLADDNADTLYEERKMSVWDEIKEGDENLTPHVLRHAFLRYVDEKTDLKTARDQGRHNDIQTTMVYLEKQKESKESDFYDEVHG